MDYNRRKTDASPMKRVASSGGANARRPLSGMKVHSSIDGSAESNAKSPRNVANAGGIIQNVKTFKGPNHPFPSID